LQIHNWSNIPPDSRVPIKGNPSSSEIKKARLAMPAKLLIFGGNGFIGGNLVVIAQHNGWEVFIGASRQHPNLQAVWRMADVTEADSVEKTVAAIGPDVVVNLAAIADPDRAEKEKELAYKINVGGARNVAESCARNGVRQVFFSTDAVFDGESSSYSEYDGPAPVNYYGLTKMEAERVVFQSQPEAVVVRTAMVIGFPVTGGHSFFTNLESKLKLGKEVLTPTYEFRTPADVLTLAECVLELCENSFSGLIHLAATDSINRYDLSKAVARRMGYDENLISPQSMPEVIPGRAPRHKNGNLNVTRAQSLLKTRLLSTEEGIQRAFTDRLPVDRPKPAHQEDTR
jgi:dTDP-4-dehydrorhamnose reductase